MTDRGGVVLAGVAGDVDAAYRRRLDRLVGRDLHVADGLALGGAVAYAVRDGHACAVAGRIAGLGTDATASAALAEQAAREGVGALRALRGEFVLVIWDSTRRCGFAAVDQLGARSLYWRRLPGGVAFAVDLRDLLGLLPSLPAPARPEVVRFLAVGNWSPTGAPLEGVERLPGGGVLRLGARPGVERYWQPRYGGVIAAPFEELGELVRERVLDAVRMRLPAQGRPVSCSAAAWTPPRWGRRCGPCSRRAGWSCGHTPGSSPATRRSTSTRESRPLSAGWARPGLAARSVAAGRSSARSSTLRHGGCPAQSPTCSCGRRCCSGPRAMARK